MKKGKWLRRSVALLLAVFMAAALCPAVTLAADAAALPAPYTGSLTYGKPVTASGNTDDGAPGQGVDADVSTKWCSTVPVADNSSGAESGAQCHWLAVDLGESKTVTRWLVHSTIDGGVLTHQIASTFKLQVKDAGGKWTDVASVTGNTEQTFQAELPTPVTGREFRLWLPGAGCNQPGGDSYPRIGEFHLFETTSEQAELPAPYTGSLTYQKPAEVSAQAAESETAANAVDANPNTKWAVFGSNTANIPDQSVADDSKDAEEGAKCHWLKVDLGEETTVRRWLVQSKTDDGSETSLQNAGTFKLQVLNAANEWETVASVTGNTKTTYHADLETAVAGRYFRLWLPGSGCNQPGGDSHARIGEFHLFATRMDGSGEEEPVPTGPYAGSLTLGKPAEANASVSETEGAMNAVDGNDASKWCSVVRDLTVDDRYGGYWLQVDLGETKTVRRWELMNTIENTAWITRDFDLQVKDADGEWQTVASVEGNVQQRYEANLPQAATGRYFRLVIHCTAAWVNPGEINIADTANYARIQEFHLYADSDPSLETSSEPKAHNIDYVNPLIGTQDRDHTQNNAGSTPYVSPPFAMTNFYANTREYRQGIDAYSYDDTSILGIVAGHRPMLHMGDYGQISVMPQVGAIKPSSEDRKLSFDTDGGVKQETATPYLYAADVGTAEGTPVSLQFTSTERCSILQFTYEADSANVLVEAARDSAYKDGYVEIDATRNEITGYSAEFEKAAFLNMQNVPDVKGYFVIQFSAPMTSYGTYTGYTVSEGATSASGKGLGGYATFDTSSEKTIEVRIGTSFISVEQARANLQQEIGEISAADRQSFEQVEDNLKKTWSGMVDQIEIESSDEDAKTIFYTALYHAMQLPRQMHEWIDGVYDHETNTYVSGTPVHRSFFDLENNVFDGYAYADIACWDIFRAEFSMITLLAPEQAQRIVSGLLNAYEEGGYMPKWPNPGYTSVMIGTHADSLVAEAVSKGLLDNVTDPYITNNYDGKTLIEEAYAAVWQDAMVPQEGDGTIYKWADWGQNEPYEARGGLTAYKAFGYIPNGFVAENVSRTLEFSYDDYCVALVARAAGDENAYKWFVNRSLNYKNVIDPATGLSSGRDYAGNFGGGGYTEGSALQYTFFNPHDPAGLIALMDGYKTEGFFVNTLQAAFDQGQLWHGNEPSHGHAYLFNFAGRPDLTQKYVRQILLQNYRTSYDGMSGNDDCGQMSSWYMFSAMGFYPFNPVSGEYQIASPIFDKVTIHVPLLGKDFVITADGTSTKNLYIQSATLNNSPLDVPVITWQQIITGGELDFMMGDTPSGWGSEYTVQALDYSTDATNPEEGYEPPFFADSTVTLVDGSLQVRYSDPQSLTFTIQYITNQLSGITLNGQTLVEGTDYTFTDAAKTRLTIPGSTLISAGKGVLTLRFDFDRGSDSDFTLSVADTTAELLQYMVQAMEQIQTEQYTTTSVEALWAVLEEAKQLLGNENATEEELQEMIDRLKAAYDSLTKWPAGYEGSLTLGRPVKASNQVSDAEAAEFAVDADIMTKWCSLRQDAVDGWHWLEVDLGAEYTVLSWMVHHAGHYDPSAAITKTFNLQVWNGSDWETVETVNGNTENVFSADLSQPVTGQRFRLLVPEVNNDYDGSNAVRIHEFHLFGYRADKSQLEALVAKANELTNENFTEASWAAFEAALKDAEAILADNAATQEMVDGAYDALQAAISALTQKTPDAPDEPVIPDWPVVPTLPITPVIPTMPEVDEIPFGDVRGTDWYYDAVKYVYDNGLMNGTGSGKFSPLGETTRGMIVTILYRQSGSPAVKSDNASWWSDARVWAMANGISDGTNMDGQITREQLAAMLYRYAKLTGADVSAGGDLNKFTDAAQVSSWAVEAMQWAVGEGILTGRPNGTVDPKGLATRAEVAAMFMRFDKKLG